MKPIDRSLKFASHLKTIVVPCPEIDCEFRLRELTYGQFASITKDTDQVEQLALMIVDEDGQRIYTTPEDIANLRELKSSIGVRLMMAGAKLNGISQAAVDETIKNLLTDPSVASDSA